MSVLVAAPVKNAAKWIDRFFACLDRLDFPREKLHFAFLEGQSSDDTYLKLVKFKEAHQNVWLERDNVSIPDRITRLAYFRNKIIEKALKSQDFVFCIDTDVVNFPPNILKDLTHHNLDIVAPYVIIEDDHRFYDTLAFRYKGECFSHQFPYCGEAGRSKQVFEVDSVGSCYLVKREVYAKVQYGKKISEQLSFCNEARKKGFKVWVDPKIMVLHVNLGKYGEKWH